MDSAGFALTVTVQEADRPASFIVAVIVVLPEVTAVTVPFSSTDAIPGSEEAQDTDLSEASSGSTVAVNFTVSPIFRETSS